LQFCNVATTAASIIVTTTIGEQENKTAQQISNAVNTTIDAVNTSIFSGLKGFAYTIKAGYNFSVGDKKEYKIALEKLEESNDEFFKSIDNIVDNAIEKYKEISSKEDSINDGWEAGLSEFVNIAEKNLKSAYNYGKKGVDFIVEHTSSKEKLIELARETAHLTGKGIESIKNSELVHDTMRNIKEVAHDLNLEDIYHNIKKGADSLGSITGDLVVKTDQEITENKGEIKDFLKSSGEFLTSGVNFITNTIGENNIESAKNEVKEVFSYGLDSLKDFSSFLADSVSEFVDKDTNTKEQDFIEFKKNLFFDKE
jgi:hypothetical protein